MGSDIQGVMLEPNQCGKGSVSNDSHNTMQYNLRLIIHIRSKRILINLMTEFAREGYDLTSSFRTSKKGERSRSTCFPALKCLMIVLDSGKDTLTFLRGKPDPVSLRTERSVRICHG